MPLAKSFCYRGLSTFGTSLVGTSLFESTPSNVRMSTETVIENPGAGDMDEDYDEDSEVDKLASSVAGSHVSTPQQADAAQVEELRRKRAANKAEAQEEGGGGGGGCGGGQEEGGGAGGGGGGLRRGGLRIHLKRADLHHPQRFRVRRG